MKRVLVFAALGLVLAGCSPKYSCSKFPTATCRNMSQTYDATGSGFHDYREDGYAGGEGKRDGEARKDRPAIVVGNTVKGLNEIAPGDPVLTKPQVLRVWIKPWEDKDRDLNYSFIYVRVKDSEWTALQ